jgi:triosephosphate isomerase
MKVREEMRFRVALAAGLDVIFCAGETLDQPEADQFLSIVGAWINESQTEGESA